MTVDSELRIVSLLPGATEMVCLLGLADSLVAVSHECDFPAEIAGRPKATRSHIDSTRSSGEIDAAVGEKLRAGDALYEVDAAQLTRLEPDVIVTQAQCDVCAVKLADVEECVAGTPSLSRTKIITLTPTCLNDVLADIERLGEALGCERVAASVIEELHARLRAVTSKTESLPDDDRPRTVCIEWTDPLMTAGNWTPELVRMAGGENGLSTAGKHSGYVEWDAIREYDPECVIVAPCGFDLERSTREALALSALPHWQELSAVRYGRVFAVDGNAFFNRPGPRLVDTLEILASLLQPSLFSASGNIDTAAWRQISPLHMDPIHRRSVGGDTFLA